MAAKDKDQEEEEESKNDDDGDEDNSYMRRSNPEFCNSHINHQSIHHIGISALNNLT